MQKSGTQYFPKNLFKTRYKMTPVKINGDNHLSTVKTRKKAMAKITTVTVLTNQEGSENSLPLKINRAFLPLRYSLW